MPVTVELPNKELTPQMQRYSEGRSGRRRKRMVWRRKGVAGSKLKGGELRAVESGTAICSLVCYAPALLSPQHPHLHPCSLPIQPLLHSSPAGMLTFNPHPPPLYFSPLLLLHNREKEEVASLLWACLPWALFDQRSICECKIRESYLLCHLLLE